MIWSAIIALQLTAGVLVASRWPSSDSFWLTNKGEILKCSRIATAIYQMVCHISRGLGFRNEKDFPRICRASCTCWICSCS